MERETTDDATLLKIATRAARKGARAVQYRADEVFDLAWDEKTPADFVTEVDRHAEEAIAGVILAALPGARIVGEELSPDHNGLAGISFIVDPLDGTTNFLHGYPEYAVSIGVAVDQELVAGVVLNVPTGEIFTAARGMGAHRNGELVRVSDVGDPRRALIGTGFPFKHPHLLEQYQWQFAAVMRSTSGIRRAGSAALDLCDVACGRFDAFWELMLAPWDVAAGTLIVREAGGMVTDTDGNPLGISHSGVVAGNPGMHRWLLEHITTPT